MAKVVYSPQVGDMRNKTGGAVHTKTRFGSMVRRKVSPTQPRSNYQMNVRASFTALSKLWSDSSMDNYRAAWIALAQSYPVKDVFGQSQKLTGHQMFVRINRNLDASDTPRILIPPASLSAPYPGTITLAKAGGPPITTLTYAQATLNTPAEKILVYATPGISHGVQNPGSRYRLLLNIPDSGGGPWDILPQYIAKFGAPIIGRTIFVKASMITRATGATSLASSASIKI